jgi:hypothetical protein
MLFRCSSVHIAVKKGALNISVQVKKQALTRGLVTDNCTLEK